MNVLPIINMLCIGPSTLHRNVDKESKTTLVSNEDTTFTFLLEDNDKLSIPGVSVLLQSGPLCVQRIITEEKPQGGRGLQPTLVDGLPKFYHRHPT